MTMISAISQAPADPYAQLVRELQLEFDCGDVDSIAQRIVEAEAADFHWQARVRDRYLGQHFSADFCMDQLDEDVSEVAILSFLAGRWHAGVCLVDGEGGAVDMLWKRDFGAREEAEVAFLSAR